MSNNIMHKKCLYMITTISSATAGNQREKLGSSLWEPSHHVQDERPDCLYISSHPRKGCNDCLYIFRHVEQVGRKG